MERRQILTEFTVVGTFAAMVVITTLSNLDLAAIATALGLSESTLSAATGTGAYLLLFRAMTAAYYKFAWPLVHAGRFVGGTWNYTYNQSYDAEKKEWDEAHTETGRAVISHSVEDITLDGVSFVDPSDGKQLLRSSWETTASALSRNTIHLSAMMRSGDGLEADIAILQIVPRRALRVFPVFPKEMVGWYFVAPNAGKPGRYAQIVFGKA
jgi:hypothetical protein